MQLQETAVPKQRQAPLSPLRALVACGWLSEPEADSPEVQVEDLSFSQTVVRVTAPNGRSVIVKQAAPATKDEGRDLRRELYVYRLAYWLRPLADVLPTALLLDERRHVLVVDWVDDSSARSVPGYDLGAALGRAMAAWHEATANVALLPSLAEGILSLPDAVEDAAKGRPPVAQEFMRTLAGDPELADLLREGRERWRYVELVHGDLRRDNWRLDCGAVHGVLVIDWEFSGAGDPAWDLASACVDCLVEDLRDGAPSDSGPSGWPRAAEETARGVAMAYARGRSLTASDAFDLWDRIPLFAAARLLHIGCEWAEHMGESDGALLGTVRDQARALIRQRAMIAASLQRWAAS